MNVIFKDHFYLVIVSKRDIVSKFISELFKRFGLVGFYGISTIVGY